MAICETCDYANRPPYKSPCSECKGFSKYEYKKPQTNADRIRAMSDEELAMAIGYRCLCSYIKDETNFCNEREEFGACILEWLKQPAEE